LKISLYEKMVFWQKDPKKDPEKDHSLNNKVNTLARYISFGPKGDPMNI